jgi:hypothetical protein
MRAREGVSKMTTYQHLAEQGSTADDFIGSSEKTRRGAAGSAKRSGNNGSFDPSKYMLMLPKNKKVKMPNGQVKWEKTEAAYLPVAPRIAWFRKEHPDWGIITRAVRTADKAVIMKATIKDGDGRVIATARKKETESGFADYIEKAETGAVGRALAMCGYGTLQAPEFDEGNRLADAPSTKSRKRH